MSLPDQEARSLEEALQLLCDLSSGVEKRIPSATRQRARRILKHYPLDPSSWSPRSGTMIGRQ